MTNLRKALDVAFSAALDEVASEAAHMTLYIYGRDDVERIVAKIRNKADHITTQLFEAEFAGGHDTLICKTVRSRAAIAKTTGQ